MFAIKNVINMERKKKYLFLGITEAFVALGALPAGYSMIVEPDGGGLGMTLSLLSGSPFKDFFIPGLFLFIVNGLLNVAGAVLSFKKSKFAPVTGLVLGFGLLIWIVVQVYSVGLNHFLQPAYFMIGVGEIILSFSLYSAKDNSQKV